MFFDKITQCFDNYLPKPEKAKKDEKQQPRYEFEKENLQLCCCIKIFKYEKNLKILSF